MSRGLLVGVLVIMVGLLGVMSNLVKSSASPDKDKAKEEAQQAQEKQNMDKQLDQQTQDKMAQLKKAVDAQKSMRLDNKPGAPDGIPLTKAEAMKEAAVIHDEADAKQKSTKPLKQGGTKAPGVADIRWDWYKDRKDGSSGLDAVVKQAEEEKKKAPGMIQQKENLEGPKELQQRMAREKAEAGHKH